MTRLHNVTVFFTHPLILIALFTGITLLHGVAHTATVSADLIQHSGNSLTIKIHIPSPPPASIIVQFFIPAGTGIVKSSPEISKFDSKNHSAKWLLREIASGTTNISLATSKRINLKDAAAVVRYRDRNSGSVVEIRAVSN